MRNSMLMEGKMQYQLNDKFPKSVDKWNRNWLVTMTRNKTNRESSERESSIFSSIICDRGSIVNQRGKENTGVHMEKRKTALESHTKIKIQVQLTSENYVMFSTIDDSLRFPSDYVT